MSSETLKVQVLADFSRPSKVGTRVTYMPRDLLAGCSFDTGEISNADENTSGDDTRRE